MAMKDYLAVSNHESSIDWNSLFDAQGNKIMDFYNPGAIDFGNKFLQKTDGGPFYVISWDGAWSKYGTDGQRIAGQRFVFTTDTQTIIRSADFSSADTFYFHSGQTSAIHAIPASTTEVDDTPTWPVFSAPGQDGWPIAYTIVQRVIITTYNSVETMFILTHDGSTGYKLLSRAISGGSWTDHTIPVVFATLPLSSAMIEVVANRMVLFQTNNSIPAADPAAFVSPLTAISFDAGTNLAPAGAVTTYELGFGNFSEVSQPVVYNGKIYGRTRNDGAGSFYWSSFDPITLAVTHVEVPSTTLTATLGGIVHTFTYQQDGNGDDVTPFNDGTGLKWLTHGTRWDSSTGTTRGVDSWIVLSADASTIIRTLTETTHSGSAQRMYGSATFRFNAHQITGNVTVGGTPTANINVGLVNSNGKVSIQTVTDVNGNYTLPCLDGNTKQVVAYAANGTTEVHGQVTPTEVL